MSNAHAQAIIDLLEAAVSGTAVDVYDGKAPNLEDPPWLSVYPDPGLRHRGELANAARMTGDSDAVQQEIVVHAVGQSRWQAGGAADLAAGALVSVIPVVAGWRCWKIVQTYAQPAREDSNYPDLWLAAAAYRVRAVPT